MAFEARAPRAAIVVRIVALLLGLGPTALWSQPAARDPHTPYRRTLIEEGIRVDLAVDPVTPVEAGGAIRAGDYVRVRFTISDTLSRRPITGANPSAWIDLRREGADTGRASCTGRIARLLSGSIFSRAEVDLNTFYVIVMNDDPSLTVVDPLFSYGATNMLALVTLASPATDWALSADGERLFVSMPAARAVAMVNTADWRVVKNIPMGGEPGRMALTSGGDLWVACAASADGSGASSAAVIDAADGSLKHTLPAGAGAHDLAVSDDGRAAFVTNADDGTVTMIDGAAYRVLAQVPAGLRPVSISYSATARAAFVSGERSGTVTVIDGAAPRVRRTIAVEPGITRIRFAPGGRFAFVVNPTTDHLHIIDAAAERLVQTATVEKAPDAVYFTDQLAYVRSSGSESVLMIPLDGIGKEGAAVPVADFPGGQLPPGRFAHPALADGIVQAAGSGAMLVANPMDRAVYYYMQGMAAPMGSFSNDRREARAVMVLDRSLREVKPGTYETIARLENPGVHDIALLLDAPRIVHCFGIDVAANEELALRTASGTLGPVAVEHIGDGTLVPAGREMTLRFRLSDPKTHTPLAGLADVRARANSAAGTWWNESVAEPGSTPGEYAIRFTLPEQGIYYIYVGCASRGLAYNNTQFRVIQAVTVDPTHGTASN